MSGVDLQNNPAFGSSEMEAQVPREQFRGRHNSALVFGEGNQAYLRHSPRPIRLVRDYRRRLLARPFVFRFCLVTRAARPRFRVAPSIWFSLDWLLDLPLRTVARS
jgi:hypothetical protein